MRVALIFSIQLIAFLCLLPFSAQAEEVPTLQEKVPEGMLKGEKDNFLTLSIENDLFASGSDRDYTSGVRLTFFDVTDDPRKLGEFLDGILPIFSINETTSVAYSVGHNLYTPEDITISEPQPQDRPWAAFLYASAGLSSIVDNQIDEVELTVGIVGPAAQGEAIQNFVHDIVDARNPKGWDNQLENEAGFILSWRRRWPAAYSQDIGRLAFSVQPNFGASIGNIYTFAESGLLLTLSPDDGRWQDAPVLVRPSIPGSGFFQTRNSRLGWYLFGGIQGRAVARNIFLDGNTFKSSPSVDKKPFVLDASAGVAFTFRNARLGYTLVYRTKEFEGQGAASLFGAISIGLRF